MPYFDRKFLGSGPSFHELVTCKSFFFKVFLNVNSDTQLKCLE